MIMVSMEGQVGGGGGGVNNILLNSITHCLLHRTCLTHSPVGVEFGSGVGPGLGLSSN